MKTEILKMLKSCDGYTSGQELCRSFGVSRTAIWKVINQLKEEGYMIEAVSNKGYKLLGTPDVITTSELESSIDTELIGKKVRYYSEVDSTNTIAKQIAEEPNSEGFIIIAEKQKHGKGRRGKVWETPIGTGIFMSLILKPKINPSNASMLTLIAGLAVIRGIKKQLSLDAYIKWPNDIVIGSKKVCGILTEMSAEIDYINHVIVGVGINANIDEFSEEIGATATSLSLELGEKIVRSKLIASIMNEFEDCYFTFLKTEDLSNLVDEYNSILINKGREVKIFEREREYRGRALGINERGELLVQEETSNQIKSIIAGEVSVRGIYGYV